MNPRNYPDFPDNEADIPRAVEAIRDAVSADVAAQVARIETLETESAASALLYPAYMPGSWYSNRKSNVAYPYLWSDGLQNLIYLAPVAIRTPIVITDLCCIVQAGGHADSLVRMGIYSNLEGGFYPDELLVDGGSQSAAVGDSTPEFHLASAFELGIGYYWFAVMGDGDPAQSGAQIVSNVEAPVYPFHCNDSTNIKYGYAHSPVQYGYAQGAGLPASLVGPLNTTSQTPIVGYRIAI